MTTPAPTTGNTTGGTAASYTDRHVCEFPDGARLETTTTYYPPPAPGPVPPVDPGPRVWPMMVGVHDARQPATTREEFPGAVLTRPFISGVLQGPRSLLPKVDAVCRPSWDAGMVPQYSLKLNYDEVMAGRWDSFIRELGDWHHDQPVAELIIWHEPENDPELQDGRFPGYFNHVAEEFRTANENMPLIYAAMGYQWMPGRTNGTVKGFTSNPQDWCGVEADLLTVDLYSGQNVPVDTILPEHPGWQRWMEYVVGPGPWGASERGFITDADHGRRAEAIRREANWLMTDPAGLRCRRYIFWNTSGTEKNPDIVLDQRAGEPAVRDLVRALSVM